MHGNDTPRAATGFTLAEVAAHCRQLKDRKAVAATSRTPWFLQAVSVTPVLVGNNGSSCCCAVPLASIHKHPLVADGEQTC